MGVAVDWGCRGDCDTGANAAIGETGRDGGDTGTGSRVIIKDLGRDGEAASWCEAVECASDDGGAFAEGTGF